MWQLIVFRGAFIYNHVLLNSSLPSPARADSTRPVGRWSFAVKATDLEAVELYEEALNELVKDVA